MEDTPYLETWDFRAGPMEQEEGGEEGDPEREAVRHMWELWPEVLNEAPVWRSIGGDCFLYRSDEGCWTIGLEGSKQKGRSGGCRHGPRTLSSDPMVRKEAEMWVRDGKEGIMVAVEPMDMPASQEAEDGLASAITERADMPIRDARKVGIGLVSRPIIQRCEDGRCGLCGRPSQAKSGWSPGGGTALHGLGPV